MLKILGSMIRNMRNRKFSILLCFICKKTWSLRDFWSKFKIMNGAINDGIFIKSSSFYGWNFEEHFCRVGSVMIQFKWTSADLWVLQGTYWQNVKQRANPFGNFGSNKLGVQICGNQKSFFLMLLNSEKCKINSGNR